MGADSALYGRIEDMGDLADRLADLATVPSRVAKDVADDLDALLEDQFDRGVDPYGAKWEDLAPRTLKRHGPPPLTFKGDMRAGTFARAQRGAGISLEAPFPAGIHMTGGDSGNWHMPARPMFPVGDALPPKWQEAIDDRLDAAFDRGVRRGV